MFGLDGIIPPHPWHCMWAVVWLHLNPPRSVPHWGHGSSVSLLSLLETDKDLFLDLLIGIPKTIFGLTEAYVSNNAISSSVRFSEENACKIASSMLCKKWFLPTEWTVARHWGQTTLRCLSLDWLEDLLNHSEKQPLQKLWRQGATVTTSCQMFKQILHFACSTLKEIFTFVSLWSWLGIDS